MKYSDCVKLCKKYNLPVKGELREVATKKSGYEAKSYKFNFFTCCDRKKECIMFCSGHPDAISGKNILDYWK